MASIPTVGTATNQARPSLRHFVFQALEVSTRNHPLSRIVDIAIVTLIVLSVTAVVVESMSSVHTRYAAFFWWFEVFSVAVFTLEYLLRLWSCVESREVDGTPADSLAHRLRYAVSFHAIIDLLAILPFYLLTLGLLGGADMRFLRAVRLLRILKLTRYSSALNILFATIAENGRSLGAAFFVLLTVMLLAASGMYYFEREAQPIDFGSIPAAMWWAFATLTTVGYGDVTPITVGGKIFGALVTVVGVGMVALPTGIIASGFASQLRLRTDEYRNEADAALDDGILTDTEIRNLEKLRLELGLGSHTASQILDAEKVKKMLKSNATATCPLCGSKR